MEQDYALVDADDLVRLKLYATISGLTVKAIEQKIAKGVWLEGREYHRAPDGTIWIDRSGVKKWVVGGYQASKSATRASASCSPSRAKVAAVAR